MKDIEKEIDILNDILNKMDVKGFQFRYYNVVGDMITLSIPRITCDGRYMNKGFWKSIADMFPCKPSEIDELLNNIEKVRKLGHLEDGKHYNYLGVNDNGIEFLKCYQTCNSFDELKLKLQIMGYDV